MLLLSFWICVPNTLWAQQRPVVVPAQQDPRFVDETLAWEFYRNQDWENAKILYQKLYTSFQAQYYFNLYFNCLIQLNLLDEAEKAVRKHQRSFKDVQNEVDLGYLLKLKGEQKKATQAFDKIINEMPSDRNWVNHVSNAFRNRNMDDYALLAYEKGSQLPGINYGFQLEKAGQYQMTGNFSKAIDNYISFLAAYPEQIDLVKTYLQNILAMDIDNSMAELMRSKLLIAAQSNPAKPYYSELLLWFSLQQKEFDLAMIQAQALDRRIGDRDYLVLELAEICLANGQNEGAFNGFSYIIEKGPKGLNYFQGIKGALKARYLIANETLSAPKEVFENILGDIDKAFALIGFNRETYDLARIQANIKAYHLEKSSEAIQLINKAMSLPLRVEEVAELKMHLADILLYQNEVWEATLLYSQVDKLLKNEPLAHEARFRNARLRYFIGEFAWAQSQLDVLKAATSKLIANDALSLSLLIQDNLDDDTTGLSLKAFAKADLLFYQKKNNEASLLLDSLIKHNKSLALQPHVLMRKAELLIRKNQYSAADSLFKIVFTSFSDGYLADDALLRSATLNENQLNNTVEARKLYEIIVDKYPASIYAAQARNKYRQLRGDKP